MKKVMSILLVLAMSAALLATSAFAAGSVNLSDATAKAGETVKITVSASGVDSFSSLLSSLTYDKSSLTLVDVKPVGSVSGAQDVSKVTKESEITNQTSMYAWNAENGKIAYASGSDKSGSSQLFELTFKVADSAEAELPVSIEVAFDDAAAPLKDSGSITVDGAGEEVVPNTYVVDTANAVVVGSEVSGTGVVEKTGGNQPVGKQYVYIVVNFAREDGTSWAVAGTYPVYSDGEFDLPSISSVADPIESVFIIALDAKVGANWVGHKIAPTAMLTPAA